MDKLQTIPDEVLVARYAGGENEAFDTLLDRYKDKIYTYIYYTVSPSSKDATMRMANFRHG